MRFSSQPKVAAKTILLVAALAATVFFHSIFVRRKSNSLAPLQRPEVRKRVMNC